MITHPERLSWIGRHYAAFANFVRAGAWLQVTAGSLTGPIRVDQLPTGIPRATNGTTTIAGDVVIEGTMTA